VIERTTGFGAGRTIAKFSAPDPRESDAAFPVDEEEIAALEEFARCTRAPPAARRRWSATCVIDEHEVAIGQQRAISIAGIGPLLRPGEDEHRPLYLVEGSIGWTVGRGERDGTDIRLSRERQPERRRGLRSPYKLKQICGLSLTRIKREHIYLRRVTPRHCRP
jgi:hypothetical protein